MKKTILFIALLLTISSLNHAQAQDIKESSFQFTLFPPIGTQGTKAPEYTNKVSINLLVGLSKNEEKFTLGGLANIIKNDANGFQLAGLSNVIGNSANGIQIAGLSNTIANSGNGILLSGILNTSKHYDGMEITGALNVASNFNGLQIAGVGNVAKNTNGLQVAGVGNVAKTINGFQIGGVGNIADDINGFQIAGIFNKAKNVNGFQIAGILNIADSSDYPIGLINIIKNGEKGIGISYNEIGSTIMFFRSGGKVMYGIVGLGYNYRSISKESFVVEGGIGVHINCAPSFRINTELVSSEYSLFKKGETTQYSLAVLPTFKCASHLEIFGGPTFNYLHSDNTDNKKLFPGDAAISLWKSFGSSHLEQGYIGFTVGTQYIF